MKHAKLAYTLGSLAVIAVIAGGGIFWYKSQNYTQLLSSSAEHEVFAKMLQNNSQVGANKRLASAPESAGSRNTGKASDALATYPVTNLIAPDNKNNYSYMKTTTVEGPAVNKCPMYKDMGSKTYVNYTFTDPSSNYFLYSKSIVSDINGNLISYNLQKPNGNLVYAGGKYAVFYEYTAPVRIMDDSVKSEPATVISAPNGEETGQGSEPSNPGLGAEPPSVISPAPDGSSDPVDSYIQNNFGDNKKFE